MNQSILKKFLGNKLILITKIIEYSQNESMVTSILLYGPYARKEEIYLTEINLLVITEFRSTKKLITKFKSYLENEASYLIDYDKKLIFFSKKKNDFNTETIKISLAFIEDLNEIKSYYINFSSKLLPIDDLIILDKLSIKRDLKKILENNITEEYFLVDKVHLIIKEFLEIFESASYRVSLGDTIGYFKKMSILYQYLLDLDFINNYNKLYDSGSRKDFWIVHLLTRAEFFKQYYPKVGIRDVRKYKEVYVKIFLEIILELISKYNLVLEVDKYKEFLNSIIIRDSIWNLRDFSTVNPEKIIKGKLYRASTLSRYKEDEIFHKLLETLNIKTIVDLRTTEEVERHPYNNSLIKNNINYISKSIGQKKLDKEIKLKYETSNQDNSFYEIFPRYYQQELAEILRTIVKIDHPSLIHCHAGRDRTGIVIAIIQKVLGLTDYEIYQDYMNSGSFTSEENMKMLFSVVREYGDINDYLSHVGLTGDEIMEIISTFEQKRDSVK